MCTGFGALRTFTRVTTIDRLHYIITITAQVLPHFLSADYGVGKEQWVVLNVRSSQVKQPCERMDEWVDE